MFGGGFDPSQMSQMMEQFGIDMENIDAERVEIETADGETLIFNAPEISVMNAQGQTVYQIIDEPDERIGGSEDGEEDVDDSEGPEIPEQDVELVAQQASVTAEEAREALEDSDGDLADAVDQLK